ncbi:MAG: hypothetical protein QM755_23870 [Luteolibacter sp.]
MSDELPHYCVRRMSGGYGFTTPSGQTTGILTQKRAELICQLQREQDIEMAYSSESRSAADLRRYFDSLTQSKIEAGGAAPTSDQTAR